MHKFQAMHNCFVVFLALVAFHGCNLTQGRKIIKPLNTNIENNNPHHPLMNAPITITSPKTKVDKHKMAPSKGGSIRSTLEDSNLNAGHKKLTGEDRLMEASMEIHSPKSKISVNGVGPGPSPGSGHKIITGKNNLMKTMAVISMKDDEVGPGHSPGVGHKKSSEGDNNNNNNNLKKPMVTVQSVDAKVSVDGVGPSHSPGVGHKA